MEMRYFARQSLLLGMLVAMSDNIVQNKLPSIRDYETEDESENSVITAAVFLES